ncbi:MAG: manganese efflux pump [Clostridiaceae bacterium]|jgi:putative Mn2+ efflux pump MntP|nr:manganese efflux pump MntP family protein [Eubacteriales bacterium]NLV48114.1 manganese efflux pump [Clostridiaceae bacterium]
MGFVELFLIAVGLSMDAFAVALCKGLSFKEKSYRKAFRIAIYFGFFQAFMPFIGWLAGRQFEQYISAYDHWIAFALLLVIGGKMIISVARGGSCTVGGPDRCSHKELLTLAVATSIDALAVGVTFAFLHINLAPALLLIGITTFALSFVSVLIGSRLGIRFGNAAELAGGVVLILIGVKILFEHLNIIV